MNVSCQAIETKVVIFKARSSFLFPLVPLQNYSSKYYLDERAVSSYSIITKNTKVFVVSVWPR